MASFRQTPLTCSGHTRPVVHLDFSSITSSGYYLISACKDGKPMLRQGDTGDWIGTFQGHKGAVWGVALNSDATRAATGAADYSAKVFDAIRGEEIHAFLHHHIVKTVNFSSNDNYLTTGSAEKIIRIFDLSRPDADPDTFDGHTGSVRHSMFMHNDQSIVSCAEDKTLRVWDRRTCQEVQKLDFPIAPSSLEVSRDGTILTVAHGRNVTFLDSMSLRKMRTYSVPTILNSASLHPDNSIFVCGGDDLKVYKFDFATGSELESFKGHFGPVHCVRFSPDGELYASGSEDGTLRLWQTTVGKTYGLWKCTDNEFSMHSPTSVKEISAI